MWNLQKEAILMLSYNRNVSFSFPVSFLGFNAINSPLTSHDVVIFPLPIFPHVTPGAYLRRRASRSDSRRHRISSSRTVKYLAAAFFVSWSKIPTWALDIANDRSGLIIHELDTHLRNTTARTFLQSLVCRLCRKAATVEDFSYQFGQGLGSPSRA